MQKILLFLIVIVQSTIFAANTPVGVIITTEGTVKGVASDNVERELKRGDLFYASETVVCEDGSKAQLKFSDGGLVNLIPSTEFRVDSYSFKNPNKADHSLMSLVKGGFRLISGSIATTNPLGVSIQTPVATIGLRGTILEVNIVKGQMYCSCLQGTVEVSNSQGSVLIGEGMDRFASILKNRKPAAQSTQPSPLSRANFKPPEGAKNFEGRSGTRAGGALVPPGHMQITPKEGHCP